ncbi:MAG: hypothetical protein CMJ81_18545 [Planctomycetaceae bacterium]|nr:hypothetical protein [Planctomycetaceae bacterium]MBP61823.1 hypothetical protein [Planctomycetaceae bacterium]
MARINFLTDVDFVVFDAVGTLIEPDPAACDVYHQAGQRHGSSLSMEQIASRFGNAFAAEEALDSVAKLHRRPTSELRERQRWQRIVESVFCDVDHADQSLFQELWDYFGQGKHWKLYDDVADVWSRLTQERYQLAIASNFDKRLLNVCEAKPPLSTCPHIFWSAEIGYPKPSSKFFATIQNRIETPAQRILMVGDSKLNDERGASNAGWKSVLIERHHPGSHAASVPSLHCLWE